MTGQKAHNEDDAFFFIFYFLYYFFFIISFFFCFYSSVEWFPSKVHGMNPFSMFILAVPAYKLGIPTEYSPTSPSRPRSIHNLELSIITMFRL